MKKHYFFPLAAAALLVSGTLAAQPTLTAANTNFAAGDVYYVTAVDTTGLTPGPAGANQAWDFSQFSTVGDQQTIIVSNVAGSSYQAQYPNATVYAEHSPIANREFFLTSASEWSRVAVIPDGGPAIEYSDPHKILSYPFTFNNNFSDAYTAAFTAALPMQRQGTSTTTADGYGTITLPGGQVISDVLRVKLIESSTDSYNNIVVFSNSSENYYWFKPGFHGPVFSLHFATINAQSTKFASVASLDPLSAPNAVFQAQVEVYPNPAKGNVMFRTGQHQQGAVSAILLNGLGQQVRTQVYANAEAGTDRSFSLEGLSSGVYFLQLTSDGQQAIRKIVVE